MCSVEKETNPSSCLQGLGNCFGFKSSLSFLLFFVLQVCNATTVLATCLLYPPNLFKYPSNNINTYNFPHEAVIHFCESRLSLRNSSAPVIHYFTSFMPGSYFTTALFHSPILFCRFKWAGHYRNVRKTVHIYRWIFEYYFSNIIRHISLRHLIKRQKDKLSL
jgi:hypothetical protein